MKYFLIINPKSHSERSGKAIPVILDGFRKRGADFDHVFASSYESIWSQSTFANLHGYDAVIAVGGDGTINATINGFYGPGGNRISGSSFGVIYTGTSPDFCKSYDIPRGFADAIETVFDPVIRRIRTGIIEFSKGPDPGNIDQRIFACCANIGLGAGVAAMSNKIRKFTGDFAGTLIAVLSNLATGTSHSLEGFIDGETFKQSGVVNMSAGRTEYIASGLKVSGGIPDDDDRLYLLTAKNLSLKTLPGLLYQVYTGRFSSPETLEFRVAKSIELKSTSGQARVEFDGDPAGFLPCKISLATGPLDLMVRRR